MGKRTLALLLFVAAAAARAEAQSHSTCWLQSTGQLNSGTNPTDPEILAAMQSIAAQRSIPYEVIAAIAWQEGGIRHFASDGYLLHNVGECSSLYAGGSAPNPPGLGMMQLTGSTAAGYDIAQLRTDWQYNLESGIDVLAGKWSQYRTSCPSWMRPILDANRNVIENWYMACWRYNGYVGNYGSYADTVFAHMQNRPGRLPDFLPPGLNPTEPDAVITHFFTSSALGESYVAQADGTWQCEHMTTYTGPVLITSTTPGGGTPPAAPAPPPPPRQDDGTRTHPLCGGGAGAASCALAMAVVIALGVAPIMRR